MNEPIYGFVQIGNHVARHCLFSPLAFVIGDGLSGDQLCGRYKNYPPCVARLSCACDVAFRDSDDAKWKCNYLKMDDLQNLQYVAWNSMDSFPMTMLTRWQYM